MMAALIVLMAMLAGVWIGVQVSDGYWVRHAETGDDVHHRGQRYRVTKRS